jgi:hypothetical protein
MAFLEGGYFVQAESSDSLSYASLLKSGVRVYLTFHRVINQQIYHFPGIWFPVALFNHLKEIDFIGKTFLVLNPPEEYLRIKYGADWQSPKRLDYAGDVVNNILGDVHKPLYHAPCHPSQDSEIAILAHFACPRT